MIEGFGVPHTEVDLVLVNGESSDFSRLVRNGDRVAVCPVFESPDIASQVRLRPQALRESSFVLDGGRLAAHLRILSFDAVYDNRASDRELVRMSSEQKRILLTRDCGLLKHSAVTHGYWVRETDSRPQGNNKPIADPDSDPRGQITRTKQAFRRDSFLARLQRCIARA